MKIKNWWKRLIEKIAAENKAAFGEQRLDCCKKD